MAARKPKPRSVKLTARELRVLNLLSGAQGTGTTVYNIYCQMETVTTADVAWDLSRLHDLGMAVRGFTSGVWVITRYGQGYLTRVASREAKREN